MSWAGGGDLGTERVDDVGADDHIVIRNRWRVGIRHSDASRELLLLAHHPLSEELIGLVEQMFFISYKLFAAS